VYRSQTELISLLRDALAHPLQADPGPIADLSWGAATDRLIEIIEEARARREHKKRRSFQLPES